MILLAYQLVNRIIQISYRVLAQSGILNLLHPVANFAKDLFAKVFGVGEMLAMRGQEGAFLTIGGVATDLGGGVALLAVVNLCNLPRVSENEGREGSRPFFSIPNGNGVKRCWK